MNGICIKCHARIEICSPVCPHCGEKMTIEYWQGFLDEMNRIDIKQEGTTTP